MRKLLLGLAAVPFWVGNGRCGPAAYRSANGSGHRRVLRNLGCGRRGFRDTREPHPDNDRLAVAGYPLRDRHRRRSHGNGDEVAGGSTVIVSFKCYPDSAACSARWLTRREAVANLVGSVPRISAG